MKKTGLFVLFIFAFVLNPISSFSQTLASQGTTILSFGGMGASSSYKFEGSNTKVSNSDLHLFGEYSVFISDRLALGVTVGQGYTKSKSDDTEASSQSYNLGPVVRFFPAPEVSPFYFFGSFKYFYSKTEYDFDIGMYSETIKNEEDYKKAGVGIGYQIVVTESWAFEPVIEYSRVIGEWGNREEYSEIMVGISISTYLPAE